MIENFLNWEAVRNELTKNSAFDLLGNRCTKCEITFKNNHGLMIHLGKLRKTKHAMKGLDAIL
jgi:hypothetical protein